MSGPPTGLEMHDRVANWSVEGYLALSSSSVSETGWSTRPPIFRRHDCASIEGGTRSMSTW